MPKGVIGESGSDRATNKMDKWISKSTGGSNRPLSILEQFQKFYPQTWREELKASRVEFLAREEQKRSGERG